MYINVLVETKVKSNDMTFTYHTDEKTVHCERCDWESRRDSERG